MEYHPTKNDYMHHRAMRASDIKPLFSRIAHPWCAIAPAGWLLLTDASQSHFGQNVRVTEERSIEVFRFRASVEEEEDECVLLSGDTLFLYSLNDPSGDWPATLPCRFLPIYEEPFLPWGRSFIEVLRRVVTLFILFCFSCHYQQNNIYISSLFFRRKT